jgi:hypothetical protein
MKDSKRDTKDANKVSQVNNALDITSTESGPAYGSSERLPIIRNNPVNFLNHFILLETYRLPHTF